MNGELLLGFIYNEAHCTHYPIPNFAVAVDSDSGAIFIRVGEMKLQIPSCRTLEEACSALWLLGLEPTYYAGTRYDFVSAIKSVHIKRTDNLERDGILFGFYSAPDLDFKEP